MTLRRILQTTGKVVAATPLVLTGLAFAYGATQVTEPSEKALGIIGAALYGSIVVRGLNKARREEEYVPNYQIWGPKWNLL